MIPGRMSKTTEDVVASAATIVVKADLVRITGSTAIDTILCPELLSVQGGAIVYLVAVDGAVTVSTSGNVLVGTSLAQNRAYCFIYSARAAKWYIQGVV